MKSKYTEEYIKTLVENYRNGEFELISIDKLLGCKSIVTVKHTICGEILQNQNIANFIGLNRGCKYCDSNRMSKEKIKRLIESSGEYLVENCTDRVQDLANLVHIKCGSSFKMRPADFLYNNSRCPICSHHVPTSELDIKTFVNSCDNGEYEFIRSFPLKINEKPSRQRIEIRHKACGTKTTLIYHNFKCNNQRCKECSKKTQFQIGGASVGSKGIRFIKDWLNDHSISFEIEKTLPGLKYKRSLKIDIYLEFNNKKYAIEYDGRQHFKTNTHNKIFTKDKIRATKIRDEIKNKYCLDNNITLIRFNYLNSTDDIESSLKKIFER